MKKINKVVKDKKVKSYLVVALAILLAGHAGTTLVNFLNNSEDYSMSEPVPFSVPQSENQVRSLNNPPNMLFPTTPAEDESDAERIVVQTEHIISINDAQNALTHVTDLQPMVLKQPVALPVSFERFEINQNLKRIAEAPNSTEQVNKKRKRKSTNRILPHLPGMRLTLVYSPDFVFNSYFSETDHSKIHQDLPKMIKDHNKSALGYSYGGLLSYRLFKNLFVETGFLINKRKEALTMDYVYSEEPVRDADGNIIYYKPLSKNIPISYEGTNRYTLYSVPLYMGIEQPINEKFSFAFKGGVDFTFLKELNGQSFDMDEVTWNDMNESDYKPSIKSLALSSGVYYNINDKVSFGLEPKYQKLMTYYSMGNVDIHKSSESFSFQTALRVNL